MSEINENVTEGVEDQELQGHDEHAEGVRETDTPDENQGAGSDGHDDQDSSQGHDDPGSDEQDSFPRAYVEKLRKENADYRGRAKRADEFAHRLHAALVAADGRLADPDDLEFDDAHLDDPDALCGAITDLVKRKPGLRAQQVRGDVGAGERGSRKQAPTDLLTIMKGL
ncbi:MAG: hypothetical protein ACTH0J_08975 [Corynebacterium variabile]|uniref:hypothetical protein n=1 Tax=Corynebacterium variabile TaxID=1727 RepID=UPI003F926B61